MPAIEKSNIVKLVVPNDLSYLPVIQACVSSAAAKYGFNSKAASQIELAVEECVTNVIKHAFEAGEQSSFEVICEHTALGMEVAVKEKGLPFDPSLLSEYKPAESLGEQAVGGLGLFLMKGVMDAVSFHNLGSEGKETRMLKYLSENDVRREFATPPAQEKPGEPSIITEKIEYDVRGLEPHEAIQVSRCAYKSHGYTFFDDHIYFPERLIELNKTGQMLSAVAVTKENVFMGHAAFLSPRLGAKSTELTFVFVNVEYRGQGCMGRLVDYLFSAPKKFPLTGVYDYAVTNHVFTQKVNSKFDMNDCGLFLATSPASWMFKGLEESTQRISVLLAYKYLEAPKSLTLYPPPQHREMIRKLYHNIHAEHELAEPGESSNKATGMTVIETEIHDSEECAEIMVVSYGDDTLRQVKAVLRDLCLRKIAAISLFLNLEDPVTSSITAEFEKLGFFFAGILPASVVGDALILQYLNNVPFDYAKVQAYSEVAKELVEYVKARDPNVIV